jgi:Tfp pilus assembly protein PilN
MKAVNLIPSDTRRSGNGLALGSLGPAHGLLALLAVAVLFVSIYVLTSNTISERQAKLATLQTQVLQAKARAASLATYTTFEQLAQSRASTVREVVASRFDWDTALSELSRVVPTDTSLQSLLGTVVPGVSVGGTGGASTGTLRTAVNGPAFEIRGCTKTQDEVAGLMSRLRLINGVTRVTLSDSQKATTGAVSSVATSGSANTGCPAGGPTFDLVVFFTPVPNAGTQGIASSTGTSTAASTPGATPVATTTPATATTTTTPATASTPATAAPAAGASQTVSTSTSSGASK